VNYSDMPLWGEARTRGVASKDVVYDVVVDARRGSHRRGLHARELKIRADRTTPASCRSSSIRP
jgi:hypothetical protein